MIKLAPVILAVIYGLVMYKFSVWNTRRTLSAQSTPLDEPELNRLNEKMANALDLPKIKVLVYEIEPVNGLADPDGRIYLTRGFLNKYKANEVTGEEMASVIAHELGHVALGHSRRRMIDFSGQNAIRMVLMGVIGRFVPFIGPWVANMLTKLLAARLSRQDEYEADAYASALLTKSGIGTNAQKSMFNKLDKLTRMGGATPPAWLMSHPKTAERIAAIEANETKWNLSET